ncbi:MAG: VOC family protein, partial [Myxococcota bacterium]
KSAPSKTKTTGRSWYELPHIVILPAVTTGLLHCVFESEKVMPRKIFVNLHVADLQRSVAFFTALGFTFNAKFTDESATCMVISEEIYAMLLVEERFKTFTTRQPCPTATHTEAFLALSCESRAEVEQMVDLALRNGGKAAMPPQDLGFMFGWSFYDPDGHHWEPFWMDPAAVSDDAA